MKPIKIIPYKILIHRASGKTISKFSSLPFGESKDWDLVQAGWTTYNSNNTTGMGKVPFVTLADAQEAYPLLPVED